MSTQAQVVKALEAMIGQTIRSIDIAGYTDADGNIGESVVIETDAISVTIESRSGYRESWLELAK